MTLQIIYGKREKAEWTENGMLNRYMGTRIVMWGAERVEVLPALYICAADVLLRYIVFGSCET